jgi:hypothetical protein
VSLSSPSTFLCVAGSCTVVDKNAHTMGARHNEYFEEHIFSSYEHIFKLFVKCVCAKIGAFTQKICQKKNFFIILRMSINLLLLLYEIPKKESKI